MSNCHLVAGGSLIPLAASRLALRASALCAATALTRPNRSAQRPPCGRRAAPTAVTVDPSRTATMTTFGFFPVAARRSWNALSAGFQLLALSAAKPPCDTLRRGAANTSQALIACSRTFAECEVAHTSLLAHFSKIRLIDLGPGGRNCTGTRIRI